MIVSVLKLVADVAADATFVDVVVTGVLIVVAESIAAVAVVSVELAVNEKGYFVVTWAETVAGVVAEQKLEWQMMKLVLWI